MTDEGSAWDVLDYRVFVANDHLLGIDAGNGNMFHFSANDILVPFANLNSHVDTVAANVVTLTANVTTLTANVTTLISNTGNNANNITNLQNGNTALPKQILANTTFSNLPGSPANGTFAYITDCNANTWGATANGSGTFKVLVWYNGTNWKVFAI